MVICRRPKTREGWVILMFQNISMRFFENFVRTKRQAVTIELILRNSAHARWRAIEDRQKEMDVRRI